MEPKDTQNPELEGEGSKSADQHYREEATRFAHRQGDVERGAKEAERALDTEREELEQASQAGRKPSAGDLEKDLRGKK